MSDGLDDPVDEAFCPFDMITKGTVCARAWMCKKGACRRGVMCAGDTSRRRRREQEDIKHSSTVLCVCVLRANWRGL